MASLRRRGEQRGASAWPGWVDALSSLVMVVIFLLMMFAVAQFFLATAITGKDQQLERLNARVAELNDLLALEREANADLRVNIAQLSDELQISVAAREDMTEALAVLQDERDAADRLVRELQARVTADRETLEIHLREIASLQNDLAALREARAKLEGEIAELARLGDALRTRAETAEADRERTADALARSEESKRLSDEERQALLAEMGALRDRSRTLEADLADARERTMLTQTAIEERDIRLADLIAQLSRTQDALDGEQALTTQSRLQVSILNQQIAALREQLARVSALLDESQRKGEEQRLQIADLGSRLNQALASKVQELARYRSEFFGRVREALGNRPDVRIVGDRFVFQSELLFPTGSAALGTEGRERMAQLADTLIGIAGQIPSDINWVLRVDGHTDAVPISTAQFPSNWELSTARATSVVRFLIDRGIPPHRLAAAGFGEFHPLEEGMAPEALSRNRRIELKLDQR